MVKDYFAVLGFNIEEVDELLREDWEDTLQTRYRLLSRVVHPDSIIGWDDLPEHMDRTELSDYTNDLQVELNEAYETLSGQDKRNQYLIEILKIVGQGVFEKSKMQNVMKYALSVQNNDYSK